MRRWWMSRQGKIPIHGAIINSEAYARTASFWMQEMINLGVNEAGESNLWAKAADLFDVLNQISGNISYEITKVVFMQRFRFWRPETNILEA